jgi:hypothetical protein
MRKLIAALAAVALSACAQEGAAPAAVETAPPELAPPTLPITDQAGNRMEAMNAIGERFCRAEGGWCVNSQANGIVADHQGRSTSITWPANDNQTSATWPNIIISGDTALVGAIITENQMYSGGSARVDHLVLFEVNSGAAREVLRLPYASEISIRACFDEDDVQARAEACLDEYVFVSRVRIDESVASGPPAIVLETAAASYPGRISRTTDSAERGPLTQADLVWATDDVCSFRRTFGRGPSGSYTPDTELPACADYLEP